MEKPDENRIETSLGSLSDTTMKAEEPSRDGRADEASDVRELRYRPEMGTVIVHELPRDDS